MTSRPTILIIEDDLWFAEHNERVLHAAGYGVCRAQDGLAAIEVLDKELPSAVVLDVFLPGPNAFVLLHEMQSHSDLRSVPVILCTSSAPEIPEKQIAAYGVRAVLDKSVMRPVDLVAAVKRVLE